MAFLTPATCRSVCHAAYGTYGYSPGDAAGWPLTSDDWWEIYITLRIINMSDPVQTLAVLTPTSLSAYVPLGTC